MTCPCGSGRALEACCGVYLSGAELPETPEMLMRSRYSAFAIGDAGYLSATWHPGTVPSSIDIDPRLRWTGLTIVEAPEVADDARRGFVEFEARFRDGGVDGVLHERSRFVRQSGRWWYLDGEHTAAEDRAGAADL